ncbi:MAG: DNA mismatch repair protein MutS, partial [Clostridia bacterium]|nr:DNA mismatch repair protein MutS [Clostridia bacterium]
MAKGTNEFSPMMQKYLQTKEDYKDCLLLYRLGDFYEMFFEDAKIASKALDIALTGRNCGLEERAPMCGVPYHAVDTYVAKLLEKGHKVAICDQMGDPVKGQIVERAVTRVITPGTIIESEILEDKSSNYILCLFKNFTNIGISYCDVSTGEFKVSQIADKIDQGLISILTRLRPAEIICNEEMYQYASISKELKQLDFLPKFYKVAEYSFDDGACKDLIKKQFNISSLQGHDFSKLTYAIKACGSLIDYLISTQKRSLGHINKIITEQQNDFLYMDYNACKNLELVENIKD